MNANVVLAVTVAEALQSLVEAIPVLEESVAPHKRKQFVQGPLRRLLRGQSRVAVDAHYLRPDRPDSA
jgi:hypothetical protein